MHYSKWLVSGLAAGLVVLAPQWGGATAPEISPPATATPDAIDELTEIMVEAREPRWVAPTRRDQIGRIWAPVVINGRGPFRLVLDTGASDSAITAPVAGALGLTPDTSHAVLVRGVAGSAIAPTVHVDSLTVGDLELESVTLPIIADALGGADGILGTGGLADKRIDIDFLHDRISIARSHGRAAALGFVTLLLE